MSRDLNIPLFPVTKLEALAMLYLQNQDLYNISPGELLVKYNDVYKELCAQDISSNHFEAVP